MSKLSEHAILYVDDEEKSLKYFELGFGADFRIFTATNALDGWEIIAKHSSEIGLVLSDQRMPGPTGVQFLEKVRLNYPQIIRILVTAYANIESAVASINTSAIYRYINKPWGDEADLRLMLLRALEFHSVLKERDQLLREKLSVIQQIVFCDRAKNLGVLAAGLNCGFRNSLLAANSFVSAMPPSVPHGKQDDPPRTGIGKRIEGLINQTSNAMFRIATELKGLTGPDPGFASEAASLDVILRPLLQGSPILQNPDTSFTVDQKTPPIRANHRQMNRLFEILFTGIQSVSGETHPIRLIAREIRNNADSPGVEVTFCDDGPQWTPEQHSRFFAPFTDGHLPGENTGLGLAACFFIVHHHGGSMTITDRPQARITLELPADPETSSEAKLTAEQLSSLFELA